MTQEEKELLLKDLSARLPYKVKVDVNFYKTTKELSCDLLQDLMLEEKALRPYLRPLSSMTKEERDELEHLSEEYFGKALDKQIQESLSSLNRNESEILEYIASSAIVDWLIAHHFDFRGLIEKGLALEALEGMY